MDILEFSEATKLNNIKKPGAIGWIQRLDIQIDFYPPRPPEASEEGHLSEIFLSLAVTEVSNRQEQHGSCRYLQCCGYSFLAMRQKRDTHFICDSGFIDVPATVWNSDLIKMS